MSTVLMAVVLCSLSGALALVWKRKIEEMFGFSIASIIVVLYVFGLLGFLEIGAYVVSGLAAVCAVLCVVLLLRSKGKQLFSLLTPGLLVFAAFLLWQLIACRNRVTDHYDDYSHWVLEIKNMVIFGAIPNALEESTVYFRNYPPATALFAYYWNWLAGALNEGDMFRSINLMMVSMLLPLVSGVEWKHWKSILPLCAVCILLPLVFNSDCYNSLLVDSLLGCVAVYPVYFVYVSPEKKETLPVCCLILFTLALIKVSGVGIALIVTLVLAVDILFLHRTGTVLSRLGRVLALAGSGLLAKLSWETYLGILRPQEVAVARHTSRLMDLFTNGMEPYQQQGLNSYLNKMVHAEQWANFSGHSFLLWLAAFVVVALIATKAAKGDAGVRRQRGLLLIAAVAAILYSIVLLITYFFHFIESEAAVTTASERYLSTALIFLAGVLLVVLRERYLPVFCGDDGKAWLVLLCVVLLVNPVRLEKNIVGFHDFVRGAAISRAVNGPDSAVLDALDASEHRVYYLSAENNDLTFLINRYEFTPVKLERGVLPEADPQAWLTQLRAQGFTHLYLRDVDDTFREACQPLFEDEAAVENGSLFLIGEEETLLRVAQ